MNRNTADPPSFVNTLFRAMALNTGAIYEEVSKLTVQHGQLRSKYKSRYSATVFFTADCGVTSRVAIYWEGGEIGAGLYVMTLSTGWFDEDQRRLGYDAVYVNTTVATRSPTNALFSNTLKKRAENMYETSVKLPSNMAPCHNKTAETNYASGFTL